MPPPSQKRRKKPLWLKAGPVILGLTFVPLVIQLYLLQLYAFDSAADSHPLFAPAPRVALRGAEGSFDLSVEMQKGYDYADSIKSTKRKLVFVHIPKTAGTTIEKVGGLQAELAWGSCLFNHRPKRTDGSCEYPKGQFEWPMKVGYWHLPPQLFPVKGINPYANADLFAVVRDPYDRLLSEFYYICRKEETKWWDVIDCNRSRIHEPAYMNEWLQAKLDVPTMQLSAKQYLHENGHYTPQYDFLVSRMAQIRMVDYVLRMDNLDEEFSRLMEAYQIDAELPSHKSNAARNSTDLGREHFDQHTLDLFYRRYREDVVLFSDDKQPK